MSYLLKTYNPLPVQFTHGQGAWLYDTQGNDYLDALGGIAVCCLGHAHPAITKVLQEQAAKLLHLSNIYEIPEQLVLAEKLCSLAAMEGVFFANSGAEANEAAIKLCRLHGHHKQITEPKIIVMEGAFHGRTLACLSASGSRKVQAGYEPLVPGFIRVPYNNIQALETVAKHQHDVVAVMLEPIQGEGGIHLPDPGYLHEIRTLCDKQDWLLVLDEVQTGNGRTGHFYAYQGENILPDIVATAKGLGNGFPIGACMVQGQARDLFQIGSHGSTFGGNPLGCKIASTVLETICEADLCTQAKQRGALLQTLLREELADLPQVLDIRGQGLMIGIELAHATREILHLGLRHKILFSLTAGNVIRLLPPYIISESETEQIAKRVARVIRDSKVE